MVGRFVIVINLQKLKFYSTYGLIIGVVLLSALVQFNTYLQPDLGWHLNIAKGMLAGKRLYVDFFEVNMPLIIYMTLIPTFLSQLMQVDLVLGLNVFNFMLALMSFAVCLHIIGRGNNIMLFFIAYALFILPLSFPMSEFGQKEHVFMMLFLPYLAEFGLKIKPRNWIFVLACIGMLIKPFFILAYLGILIVRILERDRIVLRELPVLAMMSAAFYLWVWIMHRAYFDTIIPISMESYRGLALEDGSPYSRLSIFSVISLHTLGYWLLPLMLSPLILTKNSSRLMPILLCLLLMVYVQGKNFWYHYIPTFMACIMLFCLMVVDFIKDADRRRLLNVVNLVFISGCLLSQMLFMEDNYLNQDNKIGKKYMLVIHELQKYKDKEVLVLSPDLAFVFPAAIYWNINWNLREHSMQILEGVFKYPQKVAEKSAALEYAVGNVIEAVEHKPSAIFVMQPSRILMEHRMTYNFFFKAGQNYIDFFSKYKEFRDVWKRYEFKREVGDKANRFKIYELKEGL